MPPIDRKLSIRMKGEDVKLLHDVLHKMNYSIPANEKAKKYFGTATRNVVSDFQKQHGLTVSGEVDEVTAVRIKEILETWPVSTTTPSSEDNAEIGDFRVGGIVRDADGNPIPALTVRAFDIDLRREQELGIPKIDTKTDINGYYLIRYTKEQFCKAEKSNADLIVKAFAADGSLLAFSSILFNAPPVAKVDITIPAEKQRPLTLFERISRDLTPLLERLKVEELEEDKKHKDLTFLSGETGFDKEVLARFVLAHKLVQKSLQPEFWFAILGSSFFQFIESQSLKEQCEVLLATLPSLDATSVRKALTRAFNQNEIPKSSQKQVEAWVEAFLKFISKQAVSASDKPSFAKLALDHAGIADSIKQEKFAYLFNKHKALNAKLLNELEKDRSFTKIEIADLCTSFQLVELTQSDFSIVKMLKEEFKVRQPKQIRSLAKNSEVEWVNLIKKNHAAGRIKLPFTMSDIGKQTKFPEAELYGQMLARQFREAFPTTAFAGGLERAIDKGSVKGLKCSDDLRHFLDEHEEFEFLTTNIDEFLENKPSKEPKGLAKDRQFKLELKAVQRVFKLATNFEATDKLLADNMHSAQKIYRMGESEFVKNYGNKPGFDLENAHLVWRRAADTHAAVLTIMGDLKSLEAGGMPLALRNGNEAVLSNFPTWNNLFQTGDLCECEHCRSVLGPAAYFTDLLMFLKDRKAKNPAFSVKDILFKRRPDLGFLELNCENALTTIPYVDIVCEVLEDAVAQDENDLKLTGFTTMPAATDAAKTAVAAAFSAKNINLGADFSLSQVNPSNPDLWVVHGNDVTYLLKKKAPSTDFFAETLRNTKASAAELRAYPQYVNPMAYKKLRSAKHPQALPFDLFPEGDARRLEHRARSFALPFDLFAEEVRAAIQKTNLQRWDLMRTLRGNSLPNNPNDGEIAAEYFGISTGIDLNDPSHPNFDEKDLILRDDNATMDRQKDIWGVTGAGLLNTLKNVKNFLHKTGLEYNELLALLDLNFINPEGNLDGTDPIQHLDTSCDTDKKYIKVLDVPKLDRIHRFLRMWRKLRDWKMWELDLVICHPRIGNDKLDETFLINLFYFCEVKKKLGGKSTVEQVCALFDNINKETHFTKLYGKREDALFQNLFLNKKLIEPLDMAFEIDPTTDEIKQIIDPGTGLPKQPKIADHHPAIIAALGIREADLVLLKELTKADGTRYITDDDLTIANLSFLWRHAWLSKMLKFKVEEWKIVLKLFNQAMLDLADPKAAYQFLEKIEHLKAASFTPDELNWLLTADRSAKAAMKETDAARFLAALRKDLQAIKAEYDPAQYAFLSPPRDVENLSTLLTSILQKLNRDETAADTFLKTLRGPVLLEADVQGLGAGFAFPASITGAPNYIPIHYERVLRFSGQMTDAQRTTLLNDPSLPAAVTSLPSYQQAIQDLFEQSGQATVTGMPAGFIFPPAITGSPNNIPIHYESVLRFKGVMTSAQRTVLLSGALPAAVTGNIAYVNAIEELFRQSAAAGDNFASVEVSIVLPGGVLLPADHPSLPIRYNSKTNKLNFIGIMTNAERSALNAAGYPAGVIDELFRLPLLAVKFFEPVFTAPLDKLPPSIDFKAQLPADLAAKISYDSEQRLLRFAGIMSYDEQLKLNALVPNLLPIDVAYHNAVNSLATQPQAITPPDDRVWLMYSDIDPSQPANNTLAKRLANAAKKALAYLSGTMAEKTVIQQCSAQSGITEVLTCCLLTKYIFQLQNTPAPKENLLKFLTGYFADTGGAVDYPALKTTFDGWYWANRVATIWKIWKITFAELEKILVLTAGAKLLDFITLPLDNAGGITSIELFLRTNRLLRLRDSLPETKITLLEVLEKLSNGSYATTFTVNVQGLPVGFMFPATITTAPNNIPIQYDATNSVFRFTGQMSTAQRTTLLTDASLRNVISIASYRQAIEELFRSSFAGDVERLNTAWVATAVEQLVESLDLSYPTGYLLSENWERLRRAFYFLDNLNASAEKVKTFAAAAMTLDHAKSLKDLLRSKFGTETWLILSAEIQDALRERKRDALAAYLLTNQSKPNDAPSGKWENTNDLYAYYLLDVEMNSCQMTSRLVQGSGSVQLFVQRCFMGLEPNVAVKAGGDDGDSAWRWWTWMRKYRVWEANRKVFLWPENWIEPELKKDRSQFFNDMENELLQNEINQYTAETAFQNYLEKLDGVAQLEIAGFYQEDDGDNTILHVFGRTAGAEPHLYYYRRYDYRQWTPWEKVDLDIQGDYLIPAVVNKRLFLFWPVFTEVPDEVGNKMDTIPVSGEPVQKTMKKLRLQLAVSEYRQGKWTPKRVSKDIYEPEAGMYTGEVVKNQYHFWAVDSSAYDGRFSIRFCGNSNTNSMQGIAFMDGSFELAGCKGVPEKTDSFGYFRPLLLPDRGGGNIGNAEFLKWIEASRRLDALNDFSLWNYSILILSHLKTVSVPLQPEFPILQQTPGIFKASTPWFLSYTDMLWLDIPPNLEEEGLINVGSWLPLFYADQRRTFIILPSLRILTIPYHYPDIRKTFRDLIEPINTVLQDYVNSYIAALTPDQRHQLEDSLCRQFPAEEIVPPCPDEQVCRLLKRRLMQDFNYYLGCVSLCLIQLQKFQFKNFYHPFVCEFSKLVYNPLKGVPALMSRETQLKNTGFSFYQIYKPTPCVVYDIPLTFLLLDIKDLASFAMKLKSQQDRVSAYIFSKLPPDTRQALSDYQGAYSNPVPLQIYLVRDLDMIINSDSVFDPLRFANVTLRIETQELLAQNPQGEDFIRLNRLLLEDAYPQEILRNQDRYPKEVVDFTPDGAYSSYNWELFFHAPLFIANQLSKNQRFEEARDWYHFIFNPIGVESTLQGGSPMSKYWITKPLFETTDPEYIQQRIDNILRMLAGDTSVPGYSDQAKKDLEGQVLDWRTNPFEPHRIANYRTVAYQKTVVMKYLDNLIAWGDYLFRQDSIESINEATQLYILAAEILGPRPKRIPPQGKPPLESFNELEYKFEQGLNRFGNPLVEVENLVPVMPGTGQNDGDVAPLPILYFCVPQNDKMLGFWDTIADRLYKIRHCMNIEGVVRQLALFEPPIDPGALVKAVAAGVDISSALADLNAPLPLYRFNVSLQKANEVCNDVKALGGALLAALEKKDAEALSLLRQGHEIRVLEAVKAVREKQIEEAKENLEGVKRSKAIVEERRNFYRDVEKVSNWETASMVTHGLGVVSEIVATVLNATAGVAHLVPEITVGASGFGGSPHVTVKYGGQNVGESAFNWAAFFSGLGGTLHSGANLMATQASNERRWQEWKLQERLADKELLQIDTQIATADLRVKIAEKELENHLLQIENAKAIDELMHSKYTNQELYQWQVGQISGVYFQSYKLAYDLAKRAERCFRFEMGLQDSKYINFGYWDSLKKGLLSGEKLQYDLRRLETTYLEQNRREYELTKHISLALLDPLALVKLRETGRCFFHLPEEILDLDYPGHYFRRIKSVSITLPCVVGPYTTISCTLRLLKNRIRFNTANGDSGYPRNTDDQGMPADDPRFVENNIPVKAIAASSCQNDSGVFELSFRDERYLPFEGAGAVSEWSLELFNDSNADFGKPLRQFDYSTISDAILHIKYTAREDAGAFKNGAVAHLRDYFSQDGATPSLRMFNLKQEFPTQWHRFLNPINPDDKNVFELEMAPSLFPFRDTEKTLKVNAIWLLARCTDAGNYEIVMAPPLPPPPLPPTVDPNKLTLARLNQYGGLHFVQKDTTALEIKVVSTDAPVKWRLTMARPGGGNLQKDLVKKVMEVGDLLLVLGYEWE